MKPIEWEKLFPYCIANKEFTIQHTLKTKNLFKSTIEYNPISKCEADINKQFTKEYI